VTALSGARTSCRAAVDFNFMNPLTRREFVRRTALVAAATQLGAKLLAADADTVPIASPSRPVKPLRDGVAELHWIDGKPPAALPGATWGVSWPRGRHAAGTTFALTSSEGTAVPVQSWPLATWPDGTLKWTGHALPADAPASEGFALAPGAPFSPEKPLSAV
jgi:hypothetical protein